MAIRPGIYKHYKGNLYEVIEEATHSETGEKLVVYRPLYGERALWVRPLAMFIEQVQVEGRTMRRFAPQAPAAGQAAASDRPAAANQSARASASTAPAAAPISAEAEDTSLDARVRAAMAKGDERPDFSTLPIFEDRRLAVRLGVVVVAVIGVLIWLF